MMIRQLCLLAAVPLLASAADIGAFQGSGDVGATPARGSVTYANGEYRIAGGGDNIWGKVDAFQYVWTKMSGDVAVTADVRLVGEGVVAHRKAAVMIRQTLAPGSAYADVALHGDGLTSLQYRAEADGVTQEVRSDLKGPLRIRIERRGDRFTLLAGEPGAELKPSGPVTVTLKDPVYVGLAVSSHKADITETAVFSNVRVERLAPRYRSRISIYDLKTKRTQPVYTADEVFEAPNWSRDGKSLLVNARGKLWRIALDKPNPQPEPIALDPSLRCNNDHDFSPDARQIAISCSSPASRASQVYVASADGSAAKLLTPASPSYFHGWSPDGKFLAFVGQRNGHYNLFRVPAAGGEEQRLTSKPAYDDGPDYSRDGKWVYFNSDRSGGWDIWRVPAEGGGPDDAKAERVTSDELEDWFPHPSPNGKMLLVFSFPKGTSGHNDRMPGVQLRLMPMPGARLKPAPVRVLTTFFGGQGTINVNSWSPDSRRFAFVIFEPLDPPR
ncbi:MAG: TolB family protein [Acidobacteria bacterium]|nr:TolB family protein [Acidobacteriota bacterium]